MNLEITKELVAGISEMSWAVVLGKLKANGYQLSECHLDMMKMCFELGHDVGAKATVDVMRDLYVNDLDSLEVMLDPMEI